LEGFVAAGLMSLVCDVGEQYGIARSELLSAAHIIGEELREPQARMPVTAWYRLLRFVLERSGDPALGLRLADAIDRHKQGFWGYALLASSRLRERIDIHLRHQPLRLPADLSFRVEGEVAIADIALYDETPPDLAPIVLDCAFYGSCVQMRRRAKTWPIGMRVWIGYREQPHHSELRALLEGQIVFDAPWNRMQIPAGELDLPLEGDPHLADEAAQEPQELIESQVGEIGADPHRQILDQVRHRLGARLEGDASLERIARDLRVSGRTLQRQLGAVGASFQQILEDVRRTRAIEYLTDTDEAVERVAARLGYADPSNFRRAFRRWTGVAPAAFRAETRTKSA
jgi:AraC-like DNA-binding protein